MLVKRICENGCLVTMPLNADTPVGFADLNELDIDTYMKNPVVLYRHNNQNNPVAKTSNLNCDMTDEIVARFAFLTGDEFAKRVRNARDKVFLNVARLAAAFNNPADSR